ncbi:hypothetical protein TNCV_899001 [Trichonephila clavipes]|nr:hypothetical protein TNCV_899001 [Trichonephila clavipes]
MKITIEYWVATMETLKSSVLMKDRRLTVGETAEQVQSVQVLLMQFFVILWREAAKFAPNLLSVEQRNPVLLLQRTN